MAGKDPFKSSQPFFICGCALSDLNHHLTGHNAECQRGRTVSASLPPDTVHRYLVSSLSPH